MNEATANHAKNPQLTVWYITLPQIKNPFHKEEVCNIGCGGAW